MPKKKGTGGKGKKRKASRIKAAAEREEAMVKCKHFLKAYQTHCAASDSAPSPKIVSACRESVEEDKSLTKVSNIHTLSPEAINSIFHQLANKVLI